MSLVINHNMMAMNAARHLGAVYNDLSKSMARLSSGLRVNSAADDAAGLAIRELMRSDIEVIRQGIRNASDGISLIQTAEGALSVIDGNLIRMKQLAEQAATGTYTTIQRQIMDDEYQAMAYEIDRIATATDFNGIKMLNGDMANFHEGSGLKIHFGTGNSADEDYYFIKIDDVRATESTGLQVGGGFSSAAVEHVMVSNIGEATPTTNLNSGISSLYFTYGYDMDGASGSGTANSAKFLAGLYGAVTNDTLQDLVTEINKGTASRMEFTISGTASSATSIAAAFGIGSGQAAVLDVGGYRVVVYDDNYGAGAASALADYNADLAIESDTSAAGFMDILVSAINHSARCDVFAVADPNDWNQAIFFSKDVGSSANSLTFGTNLGAGMAAIAESWQSSAQWAATTSVLTTGADKYLTFGYSYLTSAANLAKNVAGFYEVASGATLEELVDSINQGTAGRMQFTISAAAGTNLESAIGMTSGSVSAAVRVLNIGNTTFAVIRSDYNSVSAALDARFNNADFQVSGDISVAGFINYVVESINSRETGNVFGASVSANAAIFYTRVNGQDANEVTFGDDANELCANTVFHYTNVWTGASLVTAAGNEDSDANTNTDGYFVGGGMQWVTAGAVASGSGYALKLTTNSAGADYDIAMLNIDGVLASAGCTITTSAAIFGSFSATAAWAQVEGVDAATASASLLFTNAWTGSSLVTAGDADSDSTTTTDGNFAGGGEVWATAEVVYNELTERYNIRLKGQDAGSGYNIAVLNIDDVVTTPGTWANSSGRLNDFSAAAWTTIQTAAASGSGVGWTGAHILTQSAAQLALAQLDQAIQTKDRVRASLGAFQNRLENTITQLNIQAENLQASESRISDVDVAWEMTDFTKNQILVQAATAMLAQANSISQIALQLLQ